MNQNLSSYWIFYTVANAGNISKAAKELYNQPASHQQVHPKARGRTGMQAFFPEAPEVSS